METPPPLCIARPGRTIDVANALGIILNLQCPFAVTGGGHSPLEGSSTAANGVVIDLNEFLGIVVNGSVVSVSAGHRWQDLYETLEEVGLGVVGTRNGMSGIAGSVLGGKLQFRRHFQRINVINPNYLDCRRLLLPYQ